MIKRIAGYAKQEEIEALVAGLAKAPDTNTRFRVRLDIIDAKLAKTPKTNARKSEVLAFVVSTCPDHPITYQVEKVVKEFGISQRTAWRYLAKK